MDAEQQLQQLPDGALQPSDDDLSSVAADSWSVKSEYGSVLDPDELIRQAEAMIETTAVQFSQGKDEDESLQSVLGLQSHWNSAYANELANFHAHGDAGEIWFGESVMDTVAEWTARLCAAVSSGCQLDAANGPLPSPSEAKRWNVLDVGTGNGVFLHALYGLGFTDLTGTDYSEGAVELAKAVAQHNGFTGIKFLLDDFLETSLQGQYKLVTDKGTLDAIGLHPEGASRRLLYWKTMSRLVAPDGLLVVTSCNSTKDELITVAEESSFGYVDHIRSYPTFRFAGVEGSRLVDSYSSNRVSMDVLVNQERFSFFIHDILNPVEAGRNASAYLIAGPVPGSPTNFGALIAFDDKVTATPDYKSMEIGRARGKYLVDNLTGKNASLLYDFTISLYNLGTLCVIGQRPLEAPKSELAVFACGGAFKSGMTLAQVAAVYFSPSGLNEIFQMWFAMDTYK